MKDFFYDDNNIFLFKVFVMINLTQAFVVRLHSFSYFTIIVILAIEVSK